MDRCLFCQGKVDGATHLCRQCGRVQPAQFANTLLDPPTIPLTVRCPNCSSLLPAQAQFCRNCGRKLALPEERPPGDNGVKQPGPPLADYLVATQQTPSSSSSVATVFLSYSHQDHDFILRLQTGLQAQGIHIWVDYEGIKPGTPDWEETLRNVIRKAHAVVLAASPNSRQSLIVKDELRIAAMYKRPVYPVWIDGEQWMEAIPLGLGGFQYIDARGASFASGIQQLVAALQALLARTPDRVAEISGRLEPLFELRNPYKGLRAFSRQDAEDFFGRDKLIAELLNGLKESLAGEKQSTPGKRLVAVVGPSGSGKSSVMLAGLLPRLQQGALPDSERWVYLGPMTPGAHPLENLALALAPQLPGRSLQAIREDLQDDTGRGLHLLVRVLVQQHEKRVVLLLDQFEELFTLTGDERERQIFVNLLLTAITEPCGPLIGLLTLRADFYDRLPQYPQLARLIKDYHHLVLPMELEDLRAVIEKPAALPDVQMSFEGPLVGDLLFEVQGQPGALPLLQFALDQLFQRRSGHQLTLAAYQAIGGVRGALRRQAEATYDALPSDEHRKLARALFVRLIDPGTTEQNTTRRRATLNELTLPNREQAELMRQTVDAFIAARLLVANEIAGTMTIEVSHEAVIREWPLLGEWMREARGDIRLQQAISAVAADWEQRGKPADRLYRGSQLKEARAWATRNTPSSNEVEFLDASSARSLRWMASVSVIVLLLLATTGVASWYALNQPPDPTLVTTLQDSVGGSLRYCIDNARSGSTIRFAPGLSGTIELTGGDLLFIRSKHLTINGPGASQLAISGGDLGAQIRVPAGSTINISGLSLKNSETFGSAFLKNDGILTVTSSIISGNKTTNSHTSFGGGIYNTGTLTVRNSIISNNSASSSSSGHSGQGGGIDNEGTLIVFSSILMNNLASSKGDAGYGGGVYNAGTLIVTNSTFSNNSANGKQGSSGGAIYNYPDSTLMVTNSTFTNNTAGSIGTSGYGGGIENDGKLTVLNSTFSHNTANGSSSGGGIFFYGYKNSSATSIRFSTIYGNTSSIGGGIGVDPTGNSHITISSSIVAANNANNGPDISGALISNGYNRIGNVAGSKVQYAPTDRQVTLAALKIDPGLRNNGGPTRTLALLPGSLAIDIVPRQACSITFTDASGHAVMITRDQRGDRRPDGSEKMCDVGAYESS